MVTLATNKAQALSRIWELMDLVPDPEIPVLSIRDLGIVRNIEIELEHVIVTITPTYSGCPAMNTFESDIVSKLSEHGWNDVMVKTTYDPPWTTDWVNEGAMIRLKEYGIAPPIKGSNDKGQLFVNGPKIVPCPRCDSENTRVISQFGSTACKALYQCNDCMEPFDYFKCI